jgi:hypothetical protein
MNRQYYYGQEPKTGERSSRSSQPKRSEAPREALKACYFGLYVDLQEQARVSVTLTLSVRHWYLLIGLSQAIFFSSYPQIKHMPYSGLVLLRASVSVREQRIFAH